MRVFDGPRGEVVLDGLRLYSNVQKFEKINIAKHMFIVWYEGGVKKISNYYGTIEGYLKANPKDNNIAEIYVFDGNRIPTAQDFYDIFEYYPACALGWQGVPICQLPTTKVVGLQ